MEKTVNTYAFCTNEHKRGYFEVWYSINDAPWTTFMQNKKILKLETEEEADKFVAYLYEQYKVKDEASA